MGEEVQFTDEQWETVARAAETFAAVLAEECGNLQNVIAVNWAGDCAEGEATIQNLRQLIRGDSGFVGAMSAEHDYLIELAAQCRRSKRQLNQADIGSSNFKGQR